MSKIEIWELHGSADEDPWDHNEKLLRNPRVPKHVRFFFPDLGRVGLFPLTLDQNSLYSKMGRQGKTSPTQNNR